MTNKQHQSKTLKYRVTYQDAEFDGTQVIRSADFTEFVQAALFGIGLRSLDIAYTVHLIETTIEYENVFSWNVGDPEV